ncbi:BadF/BadG/BcrA/BcrD ATPase family protein [Paracoccus pacificus]|uniref:BadF/BadG/BcrA/BcrD ATPase family protein n=1 Tax=Paracoccus pacificus TaxID=1463598 RepID=A0ABW4RAA8_9RHOB
MRFALGLDGGGSGCRAVLADRDGAVLGQGSGGPANVTSNRDAAVGAIRAAISAALGGRDRADVVAVLGLAGADIAQAEDWLPALLGFGRAEILPDHMLAVAGALGARDGIVAAIGTGSIFSRRIGPDALTVGGRGPILGDEGSGNWIGRAILARVLRAADGLALPTDLTDRLFADHGGISGVIEFARDASGADFARLAPQVLAAADDPAAREVLMRADALIAAAIDRLQPDAGSVPVAFTGGLGAHYAARLRGRWQIIQPKGTALDGALAQALGLLRG